ncbi:type II toxin-antitoxin system RelE/ParE family toxin [Parapedobacter soli]|uniref:type II toxin-antitoxin system RelE/ParE family toxin n=1 Tax=Parapedobacter soli TaxID=416955 RepID=UPI0036F3C269
MPNTVIISSAAEKELQDSFEWYEEQRLGLGERFLNQIDAAVMTVGNNPQLFPVKVGTYRQYVVSTFPFVIVYEYIPENQLVYILHIFHTSRHPKKKLRT